MVIVSMNGRDSKGYERSLIPLSADFKATILDDVAKFTVTHTFYNDSRHSLPLAEFIFPLQPGFAILDFSCTFGGDTGENKIMRATVMEKGAAQSKFAKAQAKGKTPALLEQNAGDIFRSAVGNVPAKARLRMETVLAGFLHRRILSNETIAITLTIPISISPRYGVAPPEWEQKGLPLPPLGLSANLVIITDDYPSATVRMVSEHEVRVEYHGARSWDRYSPQGPSRIVVSVQNTHASQKGDIVLDILKDAARNEAPNAWVEIHPIDRGKYAAMITLPKSVLDTVESMESSAKRDIVFVTDRSGSMEDKIKGLRRAMTVFLKGIPTNRHFNIWCFGTKHWAMWQSPVEYNAANLASALRSVEHFGADMGGTKIWEVVNDVIRYSATDRETDVVVLTDGQVSATMQDETLRLITQAKHNTQGRLRFFALGIGDEVSHALVSGIAQAGGGYFEVIGTADYNVWEERMAAVLAQTLQEHRGNIQLRVDNEAIIQPRDVSLSMRPNPLQSPADLASLPAFSRSRIFLMFHFDPWTSRAPSTVNLIITNSRGFIVFERNINVRYTANGQLILHRLAARAAIGDLERGESWIQLHKGAPDRDSETKVEETKQEGIRLGREWNIVSRWTSFYLEVSGRDSDPILDAEGKGPSKSRRHKNTRPQEEQREDFPNTEQEQPPPEPLDSQYYATPQSEVTNSTVSPLGPLSSGNSWNWLPEVSDTPSHSDVHSQASHTSPTSWFSTQGHIPAEAKGDGASPWNNSSLHSATSSSSATWNAFASVKTPHDQIYALPARDEPVLSDIYPQDSNYPSEAPAFQLLTELEVYAPAVNPPASAAVFEDPQRLHINLTKEAKAQKKIVLKLIDLQKFDGSFHFNDIKAAQKLFENQFSRLDKALQDLSQLRESLPHTLATIVLFEQNFHDWFVLFGQSLMKAYAFVDDLIPRAYDRDRWMKYARAKLSGKSNASKPDMPRDMYCGEAEPEPMGLEDGEFDKYSNVQEPWCGVDTSDLYEANEDPGGESSKLCPRQNATRDENFGSNDQDQLSGAVYYNEPEACSSAEASTHQQAWPSTVSDSHEQPVEPAGQFMAYCNSGLTSSTSGYSTATGQTWSGSATDKRKKHRTRNHPDQTRNDRSSTDAASTYSAVAPHTWPKNSNSFENELQRSANDRHALDGTDYTNVINDNTTGSGFSVNEQTDISSGGYIQHPATNCDYGNYSSYSADATHNVNNAPSTSQPASSSLKQLPNSKPKATPSGDSAHGYGTSVHQDRSAERTSSHSSRSHRHGKYKTQAYRHNQGSTAPKESTTYDYPVSRHDIPEAAAAPQTSDSVISIHATSVYNEHTPTSGRYSDDKASKIASTYDYPTVDQADAEPYHELENQTYNSSNVTVTPFAIQRQENSTATSSSLRYDGHTSTSSHPSHNITAQKPDNNTITSSSLGYNDYPSSSTHPTPTYTEEPNMCTTTEYSGFANSPYPDKEPQYRPASSATLVHRPKKMQRVKGRGGEEAL